MFVLTCMNELGCCVLFGVLTICLPVIITIIISIKETKDGSDAVACHEYTKCCLPRCVGVQFMLVGLIFQGLGIYLALVWLVTT